MHPEETPAERKARQFDWLRRSGNIVMGLAEAFGAAALAEATQPPKPEPEPAPARAPRGPDNTKQLMALASSVRQIIAIELRVEAGPASARRSPAYRVPPPPDPRRPLLKQVLHDAVRNDPDRARRRREIDACIEEEIQADPDGAEPIAQTLTVICNKLDVDVELARLPDAFLDFDEPIKLLTGDRTREHPS